MTHHQSLPVPLVSSLVSSQTAGVGILLADRGKAVVVMDREEYQSQCENTLEGKATYREIVTKPPTKLLKGRIQRKLKAIRKVGHLDPSIYNKIYPTSDVTHRFYATSKNHKDPLNMLPKMSGINSITYHLARYLADLLKPLVRRVLIFKISKT